MSSAPLVEDIEEKLTELQDDYKSFMKLMIELEEYKKKIDLSSLKEYRGYKNDLATLKSDLAQKIESIKSNIKLLEESSTEGKTNVEKTLEKINEKLPQKLEEYEKALNFISDKEGKFNQIPLNESFRSNGESDNLSALSGEKVQICEYTDEKYMKERQNILEDVKQISSQVAEMSNSMKENVFQQGEMMNDIENNVIDAKENTLKAEKEIREVDAITKKQNRRICYLLVVVMILIGIIGYIITKYINSS